MTALAGSAPDFPLPTCSLPEFVLSNPFVKGSRWIEEGPGINRGHYLDAPVLPQKTAFINSVTGASINYARLEHDIKRIAAGLTNKLDLHPTPFKAGKFQDALVSPVVLLHLPNSIPFVVLEMGIWTAGLTATAANSALKPAELAHIFNMGRPAVIVTTTGEGGIDIIQAALDLVEDQSMARSIRDGRLFTVDMAADDYGLTVAPRAPSSAGVQDWKALLSDDISNVKYPTYDASRNESQRRAALILWSSGTSGKSKGVIMSHYALVASVQALFYGNLDFNSEEVFIGFAPFFHIFGLCNVMLLSIAMGGTTVSMAKFDPVSFLTLAQRYRATHLHMAPPVAVILAKSPMLDNYDISTVRSGTSGGAPLGPAIVESVYKRLNFMIRIGYGLSETASVSSTTAPTWEELKPFIAASGQACPGVEIKIVAVDDLSKTLNLNESGEICIRSPSLMNGYLANPKATAETMDGEGWFHTGDVGHVDTHGNLYITDRLKEIIKVKGFQVAPAELEAYLCGHDDVADAGVTGVYNEDDASEYPLAYIVPKNASLLEASRKLGKACPETVTFVSNVLKYIEGKVIDYKWIRGGVVVTDVIPKSNSGKILRKDFKDIKGYPVQIYKPKKRATRQAKL